MEYENAIKLLKNLSGKFGGWAEFILPDFVEVYGLDNYDASMKALELFTQYSTGEFAIRPGLIKYQNKTMSRMLKWSTHKNEHVRRFASEGCRPRLPWGMGVPWLKKDPAKVFEILENLMEDESEYVRKSAANNLNDISMDHPDLVLKFVSKWIGSSEQTDWILKHGCRTLLKKENKKALRIFGISKSAHIEIKNLLMDSKKIKIGSTTYFQFDVVLKEKKECKVRLEYKIEFINVSRSYSNKIFKISETGMNPGEQKHYRRKLSFTDLTIRKHFPGKHRLTVIANGNEMTAIDFNLNW